MSSHEPRRHVVTFYSYKGGCGRTMAVANIAWRLASKNGLRVIAVDWDLDAPGLHRYFGYVDEDLADSPGVLDFMIDWRDRLRKGDESAPDATPWLIPPRGQLAPGDGSLSLLPAGRLDDTYGERLTAFDWQRFFADFRGATAVERLRSQLVENSDFVLCDSITGISDMAGICTVQLPDGVVLMATPNEQALNGAERAAWAVSAPGAYRADRVRPTTWVWISRVPIVEENVLSREWLEQRKEWFARGVDNGLWSLDEHPNRLQSYVIPQRAHWALGEMIVRDDAASGGNEPLDRSFDGLTDVLFEWALKERTSLGWNAPTEAAEKERQRAVEAEKAGDEAEMGSALYKLGIALDRAGWKDNARVQVDRASKIFEKLEMRADYGKARRWLGNLRCSQGFPDEGMKHAEEALAICRELNDREDEARTLHLIGKVSFLKRELDEALRFYGLARDIFLEIQRGPLIAVYLSLAQTWYQKRRYAPARQVLAEAESHLTPGANGQLSAEDERWRGIALGLRGDIALEEDDYDAAERCYSEALEIFEALKDSHSRGEALLNIGRLWRRRGDNKEAIRQLDKALKAIPTEWNGKLYGTALREKGRSFMGLGMMGRAIEELQKAVAVQDKPSEGFEKALTLRAMGIVLRHEGWLDRALRAFELARQGFESYKDQAEVERTLEEIATTRRQIASLEE